MQIAESSVVAVTVYRRGALVTREARVAGGEDGYPAEVQLVGLPLTLDDASLRVELLADEGAEGAQPTAGDVRVTVAVPKADASLPPPKDEELEHARLEHATAERVLEDRRAALKRVRQVGLGGRGRPEEGHPPQRSPTAARMGFLELRRRRESALHERIAEAVEQVEDTRQRLETLLERKRVASDSRNARTFELRKAAVVRLESDASSGPASSIVVRLSYFVTGARWAPAYTVRLDEAMSAGDLEVRAVVGQRTGEDWRNVALTLSTANPQHWTDLPELKAIRIGRAQPEPPRAGWRPPPVGADALYDDYDRDLGGGAPQSKAARPPLSDAELLALVADDEDDYEAPAKGRAKRKAPKPRPPVQSMAPPPPSAPPAPTPAARPEAAAAPAPVAPGAAPMPGLVAPQAMPAPMLETPARKSAGLGTLVGGVLGGAAAGVAAGATALFGGGGDEFDEHAMDEGGEAGFDPGVVAGRDLLDYGSLQLAAPADSRRGKLRRVDARVLYERWAVERIEIDIIQVQIAEAERAAAALENRDPPAGHRWAEPDEGFDYAFVADATVDIESTGRLTSIAVASRPAEVTPRYVSVPRETQDVFRIVAVRNPLEAPLLPGPADVYSAGKFALTSPVELTPPRGRLELGLGVEQAIKIARNIQFEEDTSGLIKRSHELVHTIEIDINNHLDRAATVEIRERVPTTGENDEDVSVEERDVEPPWEEYEQDREPLEGGRAWKVDVAAGGERKLKATWVARIPSQHELVGGNRRER